MGGDGTGGLVGGVALGRGGSCGGGLVAWFGARKNAGGQIRGVGIHPSMPAGRKKKHVWNVTRDKQWWRRMSEAKAT